LIIVKRINMGQLNFMRWIFIASLAVVAAMATTTLAQPRTTDIAPDVMVYMNEFTPYANLLADGSISGDWVSKVRAYLDRTGLTYEIEIVPWNRAYREAMTKDNVLIAHLDRTVSREDNFHWLMPFKSLSYSLIARNEPKYKNITREQILAGNDLAICTEGTAQCGMLREFGFPEDRVAEYADFEGLVVSDFLLSGRADLMIVDAEAMEHRLIVLGIDPSLILSLFEVTKVTSYLAASHSLNPDILARLSAESIDATSQ
jgi:polar amino acid transport system substrate-binding protein